MGGYLGVWAFFVVGITVLEWGMFGQVNDPLFGVITGFTCIPELMGGCPSVMVGAMDARSVLEEGVGAMGVAGTAGLLLAWEEVSEKLDGTFRCLLKVQSWSMLLKFYMCLVILWWYPCLLKYKCSNLSVCFSLILLCLCSFILMNRMHLFISESWSCWFTMFSGGNNIGFCFSQTFPKCYLCF